MPKEGRARAVPTQTNPPPKPGHADTLQPSSERADEQLAERLVAGKERGRPADTEELKEEHVEDQAVMLSRRGDETEKGGSLDASSYSAKDVPTPLERDGKTLEFESLDFWEPKPPKVLMKDPNDRPLELRSQIQLYATNECVRLFVFEYHLTMTTSGN